jgi:GT2 family glycosyltransferase
MKATVIVPTYRRFDTFVRCIESLLSQNFDSREYEIIAVYDGTEHDYKPTTIEEWSVRFPNFHFYTNKKGGASAARNHAISFARGEFVLMTDDDCIAERDWVTRLVDFLDTHPDYALVGGQVLSVQPRTFVEHYIKFKNLLRRPVRNAHGEYVTAVTANVAYRKSVLDTVCGFSSCFIAAGVPIGGEDLDLTFRAIKHGRLGYCEDAIVYHHHRSTVRALAYQHFLYGRGVFIACRDNGIKYEVLNFSRPTFPNLLRHLWNSTIRLWTVSVPEFRVKRLSPAKYVPYFLLDLLRRNVFMLGAVYEFYRQGGDDVSPSKP